MAYSQFDRFLQEATHRDQESDSTLAPDSLYGLYASWCTLSQHPQQAEHIFWAAMRDRIGPGQGLRMKGPAGADYILASYPALV